MVSPELWYPQSYGIMVSNLFLNVNTAFPSPPPRRMLTLVPPAVRHQKDHHQGAHSSQ
jgi:hypothetical protein